MQKKTWEEGGAFIVCYFRPEDRLKLFPLHMENFHSFIVHRSKTARDKLQQKQRGASRFVQAGNTIPEAKLFMEQQHCQSAALHLMWLAPCLAQMYLGCTQGVPHNISPSFHFMSGRFLACHVAGKQNLLMDVLLRVCQA